VVWKPSEKTPLTAIATHALFMRAVQRFGSDAPEGLAELIIGGRDTGAQMVDDKRVSLVSATGSTRMGKQVAEACAKRLPAPSRTRWQQCHDRGTERGSGNGGARHHFLCGRYCRTTLHHSASLVRA
jgi:hypothetical protein